MKATYPDINTGDLKVFLNHVYEYKKGVRQMVLYTVNRKYEAFAIARLESQNIDYLVQPVDVILRESQRLVEGRTITVRFSRDWSGDVEMTVERLGDSVDGQAVVVLSSDKFLSDTTLLRRQTVELIFETVSGIRLPKEALRVEEKTVEDVDTGEERTVSVTCVYALVGEWVELKEVTVLAEEEDYIIVTAPTSETETEAQAKKALRAGDKIIISSGELYDGKYIG